MNYCECHTRYNTAEFICPFITTNQNSESALHEFPSPFFWSPGLAADSNSWQVLDNFPPAGEFYSAKGESSTKTVRKESVSVGNGLLNHIPVLEIRMTRICQLQVMLQTSHSRCKDLCFAPIVLPGKQGIDDVYPGKHCLPRGAEYRTAILSIGAAGTLFLALLL